MTEPIHILRLENVDEGIVCKECGSDNFDHECHFGVVPYTIFQCVYCGWRKKIRDDEVEE